MHNLHYRYLHPGEMIFTRKAYRVVTVLGSCVALTLFSNRLSAAAICHITLPDAPFRYVVGGNRYRFASETVPEMLSRFRTIGARPGELEARVFGGCSRISANGEHPIYPVGRTNLEHVRQLLEEAKAPICQLDAGSPDSLRLVFNTGTGEVQVTRFSNHPSILSPLSL